MCPFQVGALVPWVNTAMEEELPFLVGSSIGLHWSRLRPQMLPMNGHDPSYMKSMLDAIPDALSEFDGLRLDAIIFGCTSAEACYDMSLYQRVGCEYFTALRSLIYATKSAGVHNISLLSGYKSKRISWLGNSSKSGWGL
jgi:maleate cis-trans isomerase